RLRGAPRRAGARRPAGGMSTAGRSRRAIGPRRGEHPLVVLQLVANRWWTGSADPVLQLAPGVRARGPRVLLGLIRGDRFEEKAREAGVSPVPGLSLEARVRPVALWRDVARLRRLVRAEGVDVVHTHHSHDHWLGWISRRGAAL